ncbi:Nif3-like dinuclear metal center hexameric protein [Nocardia donostiensis]|uniref:GTP cyclohydrolase 1 type 2 homolog n=1 Tax=Nocardia donostiensis TaxID=1538463 RepID=A0A1V2TGU9_9NOCA|nr:Nif3-like dinuclear metal center hexameric protein [Nocardia donostiensis]ONM48742.1 Nif3-like dinuclear metal center hexameric protein [Nocardia donostiensis]OQS16976.1 Nif3-like dinuclear metal center hexameric protein [Nocardia donostiensis]OQS23356.1 Nif3-like dinuclear metal center hexameric protein [Nocardia donostiensis]
MAWHGCDDGRCAVTTLADLIEVLDAAYPPKLAESWDSVGLVCGDPGETVQRVLFAVDVTAAVVDEALQWGAQALVAHHPLLLRGVDSVAADRPKGALLHRLIRSGCALFTAHTNADSADPGVSDALADAVGLTVTGPLDAKPVEAADKWTVQVPCSHTEDVLAALFAAGAGGSGDYREAAWRVTGVGQFRPGQGASPAIGTIGELERVEEDRIEVVAPPRARAAVLAALRAAHPYEVPAYHVTERAPLSSGLGLGRVGELPEPLTLREFTARAAAGLPATAWGVRAAGDPDRLIRAVAVCGGAGDSLLDAATRRGVDAYLTADLRHHPADEHLRRNGPALIDAAHWATEFPWCAQAESVVRAGLPDLTTRVSALRTDPWTVAHR